MSTAELGISLAEMIRQDKVHAICCTGANLEEDIFNLVAHDHYERVPHYRDLTPAGREGAARAAPEPRHRHLHPRRGSDAPHRERRCSRSGWQRDKEGERFFPHEFIYEILRDGRSEEALPDRSRGQLDDGRGAKRICRSSSPAGRTRRSATCSPATVITGDLKNVHTVRTGIEYMIELADWYTRHATARFVHRLLPDRRRHRGRLPDLRRADAPPGPAAHDVPLWGYFCQISDSTTSYGSYSGAVPNEKITWGKLGADTPKLHHRVRRDDRRAADFCVGARLVALPRFLFFLSSQT